MKINTTYDIIENIDKYSEAHLDIDEEKREFDDKTAQESWDTIKAFTENVDANLEELADHAEALMQIVDIWNNSFKKEMRIQTAEEFKESYKSLADEIHLTARKLIGFSDEINKCLNEHSDKIDKYFEIK